MRRIFTLCVICVMGVSTLSAQDIAPDTEVNGWRLVSIRDVYNELDETALRTQALAPDGSAVAWTGRDELCVYALDESSEPTCSPVPSDSLLDRVGSRFDRLAWSPDSSTIALTANYYLYLNEPDMWLFDIASGDFTNISEDNTYEVFGNGSEGALIDIMPFWGSDGALYFIRGGRSVALSIERYDLTSETLETWFEFPSEYGNNPSIMPFPAFNPSGDAVAFGYFESDINSPRNGVYTVDASGNLEQMTTTDALTDLFPEWVSEVTALPIGVVWTEAGIIVALEMQEESIYVSRALYLIDPETGDAQLLTDYAQFDSVSDYLGSPNESDVPIVPYYAAAPLDGSVLLYVSDFLGAGNAQVIAQPILPAGDSQRLASYETSIADAHYALSQTMHQSLQPINAANQVLIGGYLYTFEAPAQSMFGS